MDIKKRVLITAGPTWVRIDDVRVISNIATGETGILLADRLAKAGARVTLVLGPVNACCLDKKIKVISFRFFEELRNIVKKELRSLKYEIIIHSAAVSDFKPKQEIKGKIGSDKAKELKLMPLPKIIRDIRRLAVSAKVVMFKLESGVSDAILQQRARGAAAKFKADFIVANRLNPYGAFILDKNGKEIFVRNKNDLAKKLTKLLLTNI